MEHIRGESREQMILLPDYVDDYVSEDNPVRVIEAFVDSLDLAGFCFKKAVPNETGRPRYAPADLLKLYLYGYLNHVRSSRRLETETHRNLEAIWLMRKLTPDHKTIARFRHDNADALKKVFRSFVKLCVKMELYGKELIAVDGSKFKAVNSKNRNHSLRNLEKTVIAIDKQVEDYMGQLDTLDSEESAVESKKSAKDIHRLIADLQQKKADLQSSIEELKDSGQTQKSQTDPDSRRMKMGGNWDIGYNVQTAVDAKHKLIVEFDVTNQPNDGNQLSPMSEKAADILGTHDFVVVADGGYDSASDIGKCIQNGVTPHVAGAEYDICLPSDGDGIVEPITSHENGHCVYLPERNVCLCPMGKILYPGCYQRRKSGTVIGEATFYNGRACSQCACKCTTEKKKTVRIVMPKTNFSKVYMDEGLIARRVRISPDPEIIRNRRCIVEHPFGSIKCSMGMNAVLTKGLQNVSGEFSLAFLAYNLRRVLNIVGSKKIRQAIAVT